jgi:hypothetical protein
MSSLITGLAEEVPRYPEPPRRTLRVFAFDPMVARLSGTETVTLAVPYEPLSPGPNGELLQVIDYDGVEGCYYEPVDLDDPRILLQDGLPPSERDPRFHQQMVYAVISSLLESFEQALGRRFRWRGSDRLRVFPHSFRGHNARFVPDMDGSLQFGYFRADERNPGRNLPGQNVFTCLSHDILVHEAAHALVHRQRARFKEPTNLDVYAFHEGFADIVALFQHFTLPGLVNRYIQENRADLTARSPLVELAQQFGEGSGQGRALRSALGEQPDPLRLSRTFEPHRRGALLVAAVFDGFFAAYQNAIADLIRIGTSGTGVLPEGALHPDLVNRVTEEARRMAGRCLSMCIRAFQYLPPVDVTFGDFLRSVVTADRDLDPADEDQSRAALVEGFRKRGIYPTDVVSLADDALAWPDAEDRRLPDLDPSVIEPLVLDTAVGLRQRRGEREAARGSQSRGGWLAAKFAEYANRNRTALGLDPDLPVEVDGFHAAFRVSLGGHVRVDVVVRFVQSAPEEIRGRLRRRLGGVPLRGGATLVADATGRIRHVISKPTPTEGGSTGLTDRGMQRLSDIQEFVDSFDGYYDPLGPWRDADDRVVAALNFASIDGVNYGR